MARKPKQPEERILTPDEALAESHRQLQSLGVAEYVREEEEAQRRHRQFLEEFEKLDALNRARWAAAQREQRQREEAERIDNLKAEAARLKATLDAMLAEIERHEQASEKEMSE